MNSNQSHASHLFPLSREGHYLHGARQRFVLVATDERTATEVEHACNSHAALAAALTDATDMLRLLGVDMHGHDMTRSMLAALDQAKA